MRGGSPNPMTDLPAYIEALKEGFLLPYPAIYNALGLESKDIKVTTRANPRAGEVAIKTDALGEKTDLRVMVTPDGKHKVYGFINGQRVAQDFKFRPDAGGIHRGTQGDITNFVEDFVAKLPDSRVVYKVYGDGPTKTFETVEALTRRYKQTGIATSGRLKEVLQGQPELQNLAGPMYDGRDKGVAVVRYDTWELYDRLSRGASTLQSRVSALAAEVPSLRVHLVPLLREAAAEREARGRFTIPRSGYLPMAVRGQDPIVPKDTDLAIWTWEEGDKLYGIAFQGKAQKPLWNYRFRDEAQRVRQIKETIADRKLSLEAKRKRMEERRNQQHGLTEGDILYSSWGYDQTNVDFYQVTKVMGKQVIIREVASKVVKDSGPQVYVAAVPNKFVGAPMRKTPQGNGRDVSIKINSFAYAHPWDGKPKYETGGGWGH